MKYLIILITIFSLTGCANHIYKFYEFEDAHVKIDTGEFTVGLRGNYVLVKNGSKKVTHMGNPYEFWVWFRSSDTTIKTITINSVKINYKNGEFIKEIGKNQFGLNWSDDSKIYLGAYKVPGLQINHRLISIAMNVDVGYEDRKIVKVINVILKPKYSEEKHNDFIDKIMSV